MNVKDLAKLYDRLKPAERLPLIMAAAERGDHAEADRLARAAPRIHVTLQDYHGLADGLFVLTLFHVIGQLDTSVAFWHALAQAIDSETPPARPKDRELADRLWDLARVAGYKVSVQADAWKRLHAELNADSESLLRHLRGHEAVKLAEETARRFPWTAEEAAAYLRRVGPADAEVPTVETAVQAMREFIDQQVAWWR